MVKKSLEKDVDLTAEAFAMTQMGEFNFSPQNSPDLLVMLDKGSSLEDLLYSTPALTDDPQRTEVMRRSLSKQIVQRLRALHANNMVHLDIKPANTAINSRGEVSLIDYGGASEAIGQRDGENRFLVATYTPFYKAPEVSFEASVTAKADIWSLGLLMLEMVLGFENMPDLYQDESSDSNLLNEDTYKSLLQMITDSTTMSHDFKKVLLACLELTPASRPSAEELLQFPYFRERGRYEMGVMELFVAHQQAFQDLAAAEQAVEEASPATPPAEVSMLQEHLVACQGRVTALQKEIHDRNTDRELLDILAKRFEPKWAKPLTHTAATS